MDITNGISERDDGGESQEYVITLNTGVPSHSRLSSSRQVPQQNNASRQLMKTAKRTPGQPVNFRDDDENKNDGACVIF